ncbi:MAG: DUF2842 domain-containing protein [Phenylobacterium sp.]|uniref:DUF2842 domain-containing protein n=1 Tax=Phenylobacterium sp. TaxID=1871053 RepID=UPI0027235EEA|nr:DUF2842 domain-containing protein [Phenylobacterium sp.]MDO8902188.1 DUF2842 domain-containing protein [Phenylobacterium sp.]MDP2212659.1 DUF2842 domain-containing protein [Phenylobacterium sp.]
MSARLRKLLGLFGMVAFVAAYAVAAVAIGERLPDVLWVQAVFFAVAGLAWGIPILPLISWMNRGG